MAGGGQVLKNVGGKGGRWLWAGALERLFFIHWLVRSPDVFVYSAPVLSTPFGP